MAGPVAVRLLDASEREAVLAHLARDARANLFLMDVVARHGERPEPGEMRSEVAVARRGDELCGVVCLRPSIVFDSAVCDEALDAFLPYLESVGVGLVKSGREVVDALWERWFRRVPRTVIVDRLETALAVRSEGAKLAPAPDVRRARRADLEPLVIAARESLREEDRPDPFAGDARAFRQWVAGRVGRARVIESQGRVVFVGYADVQRKEGWLLQGVYTFPEARGLGFATRGVSGMCREAFAAGSDHVQLAVVEGNVAGFRLYEAIGFKPFASLRTILFSHT